MRGVRGGERGQRRCDGSEEVRVVRGDERGVCVGDKADYIQANPVKLVTILMVDDKDIL